MAKTVVDARGLSCPQPVILARQALKQGGFPVQVLVDTATSRDNVTRLAEKQGLQVKVAATDDGYQLTIER
ncbi:MAG: sulfurtransferase TusA family protein [Anaerolineae bacterium]